LPQVFYTEPDAPDFVIVSVGSFADPSFPPPTESGYDFRRHPWIGLPDSLRRDEGSEAWAPVHPLYEAGRYAAAADRGREVLETVPHARVFYNVACCVREMAKQDRDFDALGDEPAFQALVGR